MKYDEITESDTSSAKSASRNSESFHESETTSLSSSTASEPHSVFHIIDL